MKVLTLTQPWASLMAFDEKRIETRSWGTRYKGPLLIHAAKGFPRECRDLCEREPFRSALLKHGIKSWSDLPTACLIARVELVNAVGVDWLMSLQVGQREMLPGERAWREFAAPHEQDFGDYSEGRWGWLTRNPVRLVPLAAKGALGLWEYSGVQPLEWLDLETSNV